MESVLIFLAVLIPAGILAIVYIKLYNRLKRLQIKVEEGCADIDVALEKRYDLLSEQLAAVKKFLSHEYKLLTDITAIRSGTEHEEQNLIQQSKLTEEALKTLDQQIARQTQSMESIKKQLDQGAKRHAPKNRSARNREEQKRLVREQKLEAATEIRDRNVFNRVNLLANAQSSLANVGASVDALTEQYPVLNSWVSMDAFQRSIMNSEEHLQAARRLYNANVSLYNQLLITIPFNLVARLAGMEVAAFYEVEDHKRTFTVNFE